MRIYVCSVPVGTPVYAMEVTEAIPLERYSADSRFQIKIPTTRGMPWQKAGDNNYDDDPDSPRRQRLTGYHKLDHLKRDLSGVNVFVSDR